MARIAGINVPDNKHAGISLTYIYGIGRTTALAICKAVGIDPTTRIQDLPEDRLDALRTEIAKMTVEGDLRREVSISITMCECQKVAGLGGKRTRTRREGARVGEIEVVVDETPEFARCFCRQ